MDDFGMTTTARGRPFRVGLIVDHPERDLDGLVLVARELAARGMIAYLVPMYDFAEVITLGVDVVVVNYVRPNNYRAVAKCREVGMRVIVLDTEGGVLRDLEKFAADIVSRQDAVSRYCLWGHRQAGVLAGRVPDGWARVTGCPRFDFVAEQWRGSIARVPETYEGCILVNTNFPVLHPRFQRRDKEIRQLVEVHGYDPRYVEEWVAQLEIAFDAVLGTIRSLAERFPRRWIVVRPHPFEDLEPYRSGFSDCANVAALQDGTVFQWLKACSVLVHHNCTTAIEAVQMGREALMIDWAETPVLDQDAPRSVSLLMRNPEDLIAAIGHVVEGRGLDVPDEVKVARGRVVRGWFCASDGLAHHRVADVVEEEAARATIIDRSPDELAGAAAALEFGGGFLRGGIKRGLHGFLGAARYCGLKRRLRGAEVHAPKAFKVEQVEEILWRLDRGAGRRVRVAAEQCVGAGASGRPLFAAVAVQVVPPERVTASSEGGISRVSS